MPFEVINAQATFQSLMETCLCDLQLNWYLMYFDCIIVFLKMPKRLSRPVESSLQETKRSRTRTENPVSAILLRNPLHTWDTEFQRGILKLMTVKLE